MPIEPETKSWTWVLERKCEECGFDTRSFPSSALAGLLREVGDPWPELLGHPLARVRPNESTWSALEYGCHVRDALRLGTYRVGLMLNEDNPQFANWDQDETAVSDHYELQDPAVVAEEITAAAGELADLYETVGDDQWNRPGVRSDGAPFTVDSFGRYFLHDPFHHIFDVRRGYTSLGESSSSFA
ncbi:MAG TPA: DinB family protein [Ilumatobacteraceae bacterium]|nr:DinB family protein [Ilumatobacteraceae bacterium]